MDTESEFELVSRVIKARRTVRAFTADKVADSDISEVIETAVWAPNHRMTEPWRFYVLRNGGAKRAEVAQLIYDWTVRNTPNPNRKESAAAEARDEFLDAPALIYAYSLPGPNAEITEENYSATSCAVQNLMLSAHAKGLGVGWSTGKACKPAELATLLGADESWKIVGCLFIGYQAPPVVPVVPVRAPAPSVTSWQ
ncbi:MAG: nitroreductase [Chloroflexi bacterium]|nr:nitroreductase [Chloroflexota bacterium]MDA1297449.1 nitroreductase [Chloroflexota bacterium]